jgi:acyl-CoA synthetase (NDP forming)
VETKQYLDKMFNPKSIALIEASSKREWQIKGILNRNYRGDIYFVSKIEEEIFGIKCYHDVSELPDGLDHAIIAVNRKKLKEIIKKCIEKKFYTLHIFSAGTAEFDEEGVKIEREIQDLIKENTIRAIGPNCMGVYCPEGRISYSPEFSEKNGRVAFVSQSGDITTQYVLNENHYGVNFSKVASIGNSIDLKICDFIDYFNSDEKTEIIAVYFEGFSRYEQEEGIKLRNSLVKNKKPLLLLLGGKTDQGKRAAASHTGTVATDGRVWRTLYKQTTALEVTSYEELLDSTIAFNYCKNLYPKLKSVVLIVWSGGKAVLTTDQLIQIGIDVPEIKEPTRSKMKEMISIGSVKNPLDLPWIGREGKYPEICKLAIEEEYIGGVILETGAWEKLDERFNIYFKNLLKVFNYTKQQGKPFLLSLPHSHLYQQREEYKNRLIENGIPVFPTVFSAAKAFLNLFEFQDKFLI